MTYLTTLKKIPNCRVCHVFHLLLKLVVEFEDSILNQGSPILKVQ